MRLEEQTWERWASAIERVKVDLQATVDDRFIFNGFMKIVHENGDWIDEHEGGYFCNFVVRAYVHRVMMAIRRHVKRQDDSISLLKVMAQLKKCVSQLTFDFYMKRFPRGPEPIPWQAGTFAFVSKDLRVASEDKIEEDINKLEALTAEIETYVDRTLAHLDKRGFDGDVPVDKLDSAVDTLDQLACKYICLLTGQGWRSLEASVVFNWTKIFDVPFRKPAERA